jgi:hypothetical protein
MSSVFRLLFLLCLLSIAKLAQCDTVHLNANGNEINGTVHYSDGTFEITAGYKNGSRVIRIIREEVSEVRFNDAKNNPEDDVPEWAAHFTFEADNMRAKRAGGRRDRIRFWDPRVADIVGNLKVINENDIIIETIVTKRVFKKTGARAVRLDTSNR